jgi:hypothetical protein
MHRMRHSVVKAGLALLFAATLRTPAAAALIRPSSTQSYPDVTSAMTGTQTYTFDPATRTGQFQLSNTPYLLMLGPNTADEYNIVPNGDGTRKQVVKLTLDRNGNLVNSPTNSYTLYGTVVIGGQTFNGLLLQATPTAFGAQSGPAPAFDVSMTVTGGALAQAFGPDLYLQLHPSVDSTFDGSFNKSFATTAECTSTVGPHAPAPQTVPEPTTLVVLLACGAGLLGHRRFRRVPVRELSAAVE